MKLRKTEGVKAPNSAAGLVRYFDISGGGFQITPELVVGLAGIFIVVEIIIMAFF